MSRRVALATCAAFPDLDEDDDLLRRALTALDVEAVPAVWDADDVDWASYDLVVIRSTWDYAPRRDAFVAWAERVAAQTRLLNPASVVRWNTDKRYLTDLSDAGVPVVETAWVRPEDPTQAPDYEEYVIKPAVSAGAVDTARYLASESDRALEHLARLQREGRLVMVQPYLSAVDETGETALVYVGGMFSHAVRKGPLLTPGADEPVDLYAMDVGARPASPAESALGERVLAAVPGGWRSLLYARVDVVPDLDGSPVLLELELTEPSLFLEHAPGAAERLAAAVAEHL